MTTFSYYEDDYEPRKVTQLFLKLQEYNLLAAENHLCCSTCACADLEPLAELAHKNGYVYNHAQDNGDERANEDTAIRYVGLGRFTSKDVGNLIYIAALEVGLSVKWDGSPDRIIRVS